MKNTNTTAHSDDNGKVIDKILPKPNKLTTYAQMNTPATEICLSLNLFCNHDTTVYPHEQSEVKMPTKTTVAQTTKQPLFFATVKTGISPPAVPADDKRIKTRNDKIKLEINALNNLCLKSRFFPHDNSIAQPSIQLKQQYCNTFATPAGSHLKTTSLQDEINTTNNKTTATGTKMVFTLFIVLIPKQSPTQHTNATNNEKGKFVSATILNNSCAPASIAHKDKKQVATKTKSKTMPNLPNIFLFITEIFVVLYFLPSDKNKKTRQKNKTKKQSDTNNGFFSPKNTTSSLPVKKPTPNTQPTMLAQAENIFILYFIATTNKKDETQSFVFK